MKKIRDEIGLNIGSYFVSYFFHLLYLATDILSRLVAIAKYSNEIQQIIHRFNHCKTGQNDVWMESVTKIWRGCFVNDSTVDNQRVLEAADANACWTRSRSWRRGR